MLIQSMIKLIVNVANITTGFRRCKLLEKVPIGIELLNNLEVLEFSDMPHESMETICSRVQGEDHQKVAHIPKVYFTCWMNDCWVRYPLEGETENETSL